jgi:predicted DNA-binding WGR domain protein
MAAKKKAPKRRAAGKRKAPARKSTRSKTTPAKKQQAAIARLVKHAKMPKGQAQALVSRWHSAHIAKFMKFSDKTVQALWKLCVVREEKAAKPKRRSTAKKKVTPKRRSSTKKRRSSPAIRVVQLDKQIADMNHVELGAKLKKAGLKPSRSRNGRASQLGRYVAGLTSVAKLAKKPSKLPKGAKVAASFGSVKYHAYNKSKNSDKIYKMSWKGRTVEYQWGRRGTSALMKNHKKVFKSAHDMALYVEKKEAELKKKGYKRYTNQNKLPAPLGTKRKSSQKKKKNPASWWKQQNP